MSNIVIRKSSVPHHDNDGMFSNFFGRISDVRRERRARKEDALFAPLVIAPVPSLTKTLDRIHRSWISTSAFFETRVGPRVRVWVVLALFAGIAILSVGSASEASAQVAPPVDTDPAIEAPRAITPVQATPTTSSPPRGPSGPTGPTGPQAESATDGNATVSLNLGDALNKPSQSILIIIVTTLLSVSPALLIMLTSFTRIIIVLSLTRNALGVTAIPPNQVLTGLALFLSFFIMAPTFSAMNNDAIQPYIRGEISQNQAYNQAVQPLKTFMLKQTRKDELNLFISASSSKKPEKPEDVSMTVLAPAFILSELKTAFIIGFVIFIPFLVIDIIVSSSLMSMGMMMLPPQMISMPFKILLFVLVDGWGLVIRSLLASFN